VDEPSILSCRDNKFKGTDADLKSIFSYIFLKAPMNDAKLVGNVDVTAFVKDEASYEVGCPEKSCGAEH
jgi:hypothetical protein